MGYTRDWTKAELVEIILNLQGKNIGGSCPDGRLTYIELSHHKLAKLKKSVLRDMADKLLKERNQNEQKKI